MRRFLAIIRRFFLGCTVSLLIALFALKVDFNYMLDCAIAHSGFIGFFSIVFLLSPIAYLFVTVISVAYIRSNGQFAAFHSTQAPVVSFFRCLGHDLISPFKCLIGFLGALFSKKALGRGTLIARFAEMLLLILFCVWGIRSFMN